MQRKKVTRATLAELAQKKEIIAFEMQKTFVGCGDGTYGNPFTFDEFQRFGGGSNIYYYNESGELCCNLPEITVTGGTSTAYSGDMSYAGGTAYQEENYNVVKSTDNQSSTQNYSIIYRGITANSSTVSETSKSKLKKLMDATGDYSIVITSTSRSPYDQARIMYENISNTSVSAQKKIYGSTGDQVIDAYNPKLTREENISAMESKIRDIGASKVSKHCADPSVKNVLDISASSIDDPKKFEEELTNAGIYYLKENGCYHLEIDQ